MEIIDLKSRKLAMASSNATPQTLKHGWGSLWRAHTSLPHELTPDEYTIFVRAVSRDDAHRALGHVIHAMFPTADLETSYYNLTSAHELVEQGVSSRENDRLFETGWQGDSVECWVGRPVFAVSDAAELFSAWALARQAA